jgi:hypothetical protein
VPALGRDNVRRSLRQSPRRRGALRSVRGHLHRRDARLRRRTLQHVVQRRPLELLGRLRRPLRQHRSLRSVRPALRSDGGVQQRNMYLRGRETPLRHALRRRHERSGELRQLRGELRWLDGPLQQRRVRRRVRDRPERLWRLLPRPFLGRRSLRELSDRLQRRSGLRGRDVRLRGWKDVVRRTLHRYVRRSSQLRDVRRRLRCRRRLSERDVHRGRVRRGDDRVRRRMRGDGHRPAELRGLRSCLFARVPVR